MKRLLVLMPVLLLTSCKELTPQQKQIAADAGQSILAAATKALQDIESGNTNKKQILLDSLASGAAQARTLQATPNAGNGTAVLNAVQQGSASPSVDNQVAPVVATAVTKMTSAGIPPDQANEIAAQAMNQAATTK